MRKSLFGFLFILSGFFLNPGFSQINVFHIDNNSIPPGKEGVFYSLPRTVIRIDVNIDRIENYKGPYSEYALKYLGLKNVVMANSVEYKITGMTVTTSQQPDPDQYYFLELARKLSKNDQTGLLSFTESGLILGTIPERIDTLAKEEKIINKEEPGLATEKDVFPEVFKYSADVNFFEKVDTIIRKVNIDTMTLERQYLKRTVIEKSPEQKAKEASDYIVKIKDNRFNLISGFQEVNYNRETLEYMDSQLKQMEKEYLKLFTGISLHKTLTFSFYYTPNPNQVNTEVPIFKYLKSKGMMELDEPGGKIVTIKVQRSGTTSSVANYLKRGGEASKVHGFYYRIPELARVTVKVDDNLTEETQCLVSQLGIVSFLPSNKWKVQFYKETGGIRGMSIE
jgi:hypothetical protein